MVIKLCIHGVYFPLQQVFLICLFLLNFFFDGNCLRQTFLQEAVIDFVSPSVSLIVLLMFSMCQCLFTISLILCSEGLHVTEKAIMSTRIDFEFFKMCLL